MQATVVFSPTTYGVRFPGFPAFIKPELGKLILSQKEIADGASPYTFRRALIQSTMSSIRSEGNRRGRPPRRNTSSGRIEEENENQKNPQSSEGKSSNSRDQEEIIALFRRIQTSISKGGSASTRKRQSSSSKKKESADSVLEVLRKSRKQLKDKVGQEENEVSSERRGAPRKEERTVNDSPRVEFKLTRPPSNFVKRSPIQSLSTPKAKVFEVLREESTAAGYEEELELQNLEEMKLVELKEIAKSRGLKGYSKLKKGELVELLKG